MVKIIRIIFLLEVITRIIKSGFYWKICLCSPLVLSVDLSFRPPLSPLFSLFYSVLPHSPSLVLCPSPLILSLSVCLPRFTLWALLFVIARLLTLTLSVLTFGFGLSRTDNQGFSLAEGNFNVLTVR